MCLAGATIGALGLVGWATETPFLFTIAPGHPPMMPNTALGLLLSGLAGALRSRERAGGARRALSLLAAAVVLALGIGTLAEYAFHVDLRIDQLLIPSTMGPHLGRPSPPTALALTFLGAAVVFLDSRPTARARPPEWLALGAALIAFMALLGQLFGAGELYRFTGAPVVGVALPTAVGLLFTAMGLLLERPNAGFMRVATSPGPGSIQVRRLAPLAVLAPIALGLVALPVVVAVDDERLPLVFAILAGAITVASLALLTITAAPLNRAHQALESSHARTNALIEQASDGIFVADLDGRYTDVNSAGCRMLGYSREALLGKTIIDLLLPEDVERLARHKQGLLEGRTDVGEWTLRRGDGTYMSAEVSAKILPDGRWQGLVRDISERRRVEEALRLSEAKSSGILSTSADAIISVDENQHITMFNEGAERIFGYTEAEVMGAPLDMLIPERLRALHRRHIERFAAGQEIARRMGGRDATIRGLRKEGVEFPADAAISKLDVGGKQILTVALRDVTYQKRLESEQRFLAEVGSVLAATLDYEDTLVSVANLAVKDLCDLCIVGVAGEDGEVDCLKVVNRDPSRAGVSASLAQILLDRRYPQLVRSALELQRPVVVQGSSPEFVAWSAQNGEHLRTLCGVDPQSVILGPLVARGNRLGAIALVSTTPGRPYGAADARLAEQLAYRAALSIENARLYRIAQRAIRVRDDVLGIVAHDLRSPLATMLMQAELLRRPGAEPERRSRNPAEKIERSANRMNRLIEDLLDVTRLEAGRLSLERARLVAGQVIADSLDAQRPLAASASLELGVDVAADTPEIWADRDRLLQVFENLVGNAIKFTSPGGEIRVGAGARNGDVLFWVRDSGSGIASEHLPHLFDRFWQARQAGRRGAGLGLPIVKGIVEAHGGRIWVESTPGRGSVFFFTIPAAPRTEQRRPEPAPHAP